MKFSFFVFSMLIAGQSMAATYSFKDVVCSNGVKMHKEVRKELLSAVDDEYKTFEIEINGNKLVKSTNDSCSVAKDEYEITNIVVEDKKSGVKGFKVAHKKVLKDVIKSGCQQQMMISDKDLVLISNSKSKVQLIDPQADMVSSYCYMQEDEDQFSEDFETQGIFVFERD